MIIIIIIVYFFLVPMQLSFDFFYDDEFEEWCEGLHIDPHISHFIVLIPECILILDTFMKCFTGFYEDGVIETDKKKIIKHYLKKGLMFDLMAYIPVLAQGFFRNFLFTTLNINATAIRLFQMLLFCKISRVFVALSNFQEIISANGNDDYIINALRLLATILFITHLNACIWHGLAYFSHEKENWLAFNDLIEIPWRNRYYISMYWAVSLFGSMGLFGDKMIPQNRNEYVVGIVIVLISSFLFTYSFSTIRSILKAAQKESQQYM